MKPVADDVLGFDNGNLGFRMPAIYNLTSAFRLFLLHRIVALTPFVPAAFQHLDFIVTCAYKLARHTGAGRFVGSGAV